jgi:cyanophycinase-like exopeptidase
VAARSEPGDVSGHALDAVGPNPATSAIPRSLRIAIVPLAAARGRPDLAAATGQAAFERRATAGDHGPIEVSVARVVDAWSADDPQQVERLFGADLIHFPGGDPDLIPNVLPGTLALVAITAAWRSGAVLAGASAGAMALAEWTWTPQGGIHGLGFVRGLAVVPHYDDVRRSRWQQALEEVAPAGLGYLGLDERTGVLAEPTGTGAGTWRVAGQGSAHWFAHGATQAVTGRHGDLLHLGA